MNEAKAHPDRTEQIDLSAAGWFLVSCAICELLFNRLAFALGLYSGVGASGLLSWLAAFGRLTMNASGIMALILACVSLPRLASNQHFAPLPARIVLMLASPFYLPIVCVAIFRPVSHDLILIGYFVAILSTTFLCVLLAFNRIDSSSRRIIIGLGAIPLLGGIELLTRNIESLGAVPRNCYLIGEVLFFLSPIFSFLVLRPGTLFAFMRRPHVLGLVSAIGAVSIASCVTVIASQDVFLRLIALRTLGLTLVIPGGAPLYLIALFVGVYLVGSLILPSKRWPPDPHSRRVGIGLMCIWIAGIQPTHPYLFAILLLGYLYLARGILGPRGHKALSLNPKPVADANY